MATLAIVTAAVRAALTWNGGMSEEDLLTAIGELDLGQYVVDQPDRCIEEWEWQTVAYRLNMRTKEVFDENNVVIGKRNEFGAIDFATEDALASHVERVRLSLTTDED